MQSTRLKREVVKPAAEDRSSDHELDADTLDRFRFALYSESLQLIQTVRIIVLPKMWCILLTLSSFIMQCADQFLSQHTGLYEYVNLWQFLQYFMH